ncbi:MAG: ribokinase [Candidatus Rokubacteria bacterium]|nr:ribokinase [Candidatus Rokubacteria bacterium]
MTPQFVAVGHVTLDHIGGDVQPGGTALYAALTAHHLGCSVGLVTSFGPDFPRHLFPPEFQVVHVPAPQTTAFRHERGRDGRRLTLLGRAEDLEVGHLPASWKAADLALLAPDANEVDPYCAAEFTEGAVGAAVQGWLRERGAGGVISPARWEDAPLVLPHVQTVFLSEEDMGPFEDEVVEWFERIPVGVITVGSRGAHLFVSGERHFIEADPADEVDATGAGDVFAAAFLIQYQREGNPWDAAQFAACAAALSVEGVGVAAIPLRAAVEERLAAYRSRLGRAEAT